MQCLACGGPLDWSGHQARCQRCFAVFAYQNNQLVPMGAPAGQQPAPQHNLAAGTFDLGGGNQLKVKIDGKSPEDFLKKKASNMIWGWIIGAAFVVVFLIIAGGVGLYIYAKHDAPVAPKTATAATWDGTSTFECKSSDVVTLTGITATAGIKASANCQLTLSGVSITAPVGIEASGNAKVTMTGGSITSSTNSVVASGLAKVDLVGTKATGKSKASGGAKVTGAP